MNSYTIHSAFPRNMIRHRCSTKSSLLSFPHTNALTPTQIIHMSVLPHVFDIHLKSATYSVFHICVFSQRLPHTGAGGILPHLSILVSLDPRKDTVCILTTPGLASGGRGLLSKNTRGSSVQFGFHNHNPAFPVEKKLTFICVQYLEGIKLIA